MRTPPAGLASDVLAAALHSGWGLRVTALDYLPVGFGSHHWRAGTDDGPRFVTVDDLAARRAGDLRSIDDEFAELRAALSTSRAARDAGAAFVVAPLRDRRAEVVERLADRFAVAVYPLVAGESLDFGAQLSAADRGELAELLAHLHRMPATAATGVETFAVPRRTTLLAVLDGARRPAAGPYAESTRALVVRRRAAIEHLIRRVAALEPSARDRGRFVLTHGEPHSGNVIRGPAGWLLIDWDTTLLAPPERDLWHLGTDDGVVVERYEARSGHRVSPAALAYYRQAWDLKDIALYVDELTGPHDDTEDTRFTHECLTWLVEHLPEAPRFGTDRSKRALTSEP